MWPDIQRLDRPRLCAGETRSDAFVPDPASTEVVADHRQPGAFMSVRHGLQRNIRAGTGSGQCFSSVPAPWGGKVTGAGLKSGTPVEELMHTGR